MMNLIKEKWIRCTHNLDGTRSIIAPYQITQGINGSNPITDVIANRPDFKGALYQFLIGLLQTISPPRNEKEWFAMWKKPPAPEDLKERFESVADAFEFDTEGPAFMQDFDLPDGETKPISALLIDAPGGKTLRDNLDHFIKRGQVEAICYPCAALALYTMQTNAPAGGVGHRVGLRGGGPLTTLLDLDETFEGSYKSRFTLWHRLWLNVLPEKDIRYAYEDAGCDWEAKDPVHIFPWLGPTRTSEKNTGCETSPTDVHPFQMYWGMPRRIRIDFKDSAEGRCDLCGTAGSRLVHQYITKNYGINYAGLWTHLLTPYARKNQSADPLPLHGQKGGLTYRNWLGLTMGDRDNNQKPAKTVEYFLSERVSHIKTDRQARIWAYGYDMDNMKARCWYDSRMPLYAIDPSIREKIKELVTKYVDAAVEMASNLRKEVRNARYKRPQDVKGDWSFIDIEFWQTTEPRFYECIKGGIAALNKNEDLANIKKQFHSALRNTAMSLFDRYALGGPLGDMEMDRVVKARRNLSIWIVTGRKVKELIGKS
jgi:CRISPR system Cascade subunit CasA